MISSTTPDKLAEIIRDTWPNLYRPPANVTKPKQTPSQKTQDYSDDAYMPHTP
jgi:hypothetical protein